MTDFSFLLNDINIDNNKIRIDAAVTCPADSLYPKVRVLFRRGDEIRRLPMPSKGSFRRTKAGDMIHIFAYSYFIEYIFTKQTDDDISVSFEVDFSDECSEDIPFCVSAAVAIKNPGEIDEKYLVGEQFDGACVYSDPYVEDEEEKLEDHSTHYSWEVKPEEKRLILHTAMPDEKCGAVKRALCAVVDAITFVLVMIGLIALIPFFVADGFFAAAGLQKKRRYIPKEGFIYEFDGQVKANIASYFKYAFKNKPISVKLITFKEQRYYRYYRRLCKKPVVQNRVAIISGRRDELGGNEKFVYDILKEHKDIEFRFLMISEMDQFSSGKDKKEFYKLYATSKVVIVDDYYSLLNTVEKRDDVTLFQLWHACGAFKTFGFTRLGKEGGPKQVSPNHRMYDYTIVSSESIRKYYAEGFGISDSHVLATGIPRTDIFSDAEYKKQVTESFYEKYPALKDKKIVLFAPTFRGSGQKSAFYPTNVFDPCAFMDSAGGDWAMIIKLHPFCSEVFEIPDEYKDRIIDLSLEDELNDLLFVTDLLITDYSSAVFEASLLGIPMLFYAYDLYQYVSERDFYCDFESFVPGKIVFNQREMEDAVKNGDFESEKIEPFRNKFFSDIDGKSSERAANAILEALYKGEK